MSTQECGCCAGIEALTPLPNANRPGLDAVRYRAGTHATFLRTMLAGLATHRLPDGRRPLDRLSTRTPDDPAVALLDAWAALADVLTFYQERIANEGFLRTATQRRSVLELARLVGYRLRPGVAAGVYLAFTLERDYRIEIPAGTRAQSIPEPGELPQFFETEERIPGRAEWNAIPARQTRPTRLEPVPAFAGERTIYASGAATNLKPNDVILFVCPEALQAYTIHTLLANAEAGRTRIGYRPYNAGAGTPEDQPLTAVSNEGSAGPPLTRLSSVVAALRKDPSHPPPSRFQLPRSTRQTYGAAADLGPRLLTQFDPKLKDTLYTAYANAAAAESRNRCGVEAMRVRAAPFGHNAPQEPVYRDNVLIGRKEWALAELFGVGRLLLTSTDADMSVETALAGEATYDLVDTVNPVRIEVAYLDEPGASATIDIRDLIQPGQEPFGQNDPVFTTTLTPGGRAVDVEVAYNGNFVISDMGRYERAKLLHIKATFTGQPGHQSTIQITSTTSDPGVTAVGQDELLDAIVDTDPPRHISANAPIVETIGSRTVSISLDGGLDITHRTPELAGEQQFRTLSLDAVHDRITPGSHVLVDRADSQPVVAAVERVRTISRADYGITARVTQLVLDRPWLTAGDGSLAVLRGTTVHAGSERLDLAEEPIEDDVAGGEIELDALYGGLEAGRWLMVKGIRTDVRDAENEPVDGVEGSELVMLAGVTQDVHKLAQPPNGDDGGDGGEVELPGDTLHTRLILSEPLAFRYRRDTVRINANVVRATHGETHTEILGSGNSSAGQRFTLKKSPLTYLAAATPGGVESTLEVRVDEVRWPERDTLLYLDGNQRGYQTTTDDANTTTVVFGDGTHGARLPTGVENVTATYRTGIGSGGNVAAGRISSLATRPLGIKEVINPRRASGGADPESRDQARRNVPLAALALDRLVSVRDYADFTRTFAGIGKAAAATLSDGRREIVHLTIAGAADAPVDPGSDLHRNLLLALHRFGQRLPLLVARREAIFLVLTAKVRVLPDFLWDTVEPRIRAALLEAFGFERRELAQDVLLSEAIGVIQAIGGVDYVDVDLLDGISETDARDPATLAGRLAELATARPRRRLAVEPARVDTGATDPATRIRPAQLAYLNPELPDTLILTEVTP